MNLTDFLKANPAQPEPVYPSDCNSCGTPEQQKTFAATVLHRDPTAPHGVECTSCFRQVICRTCFTSWKIVVLIGFHDHYCPRCSQPTNETLPTLRSDFIGVARRVGGVRRAAKIFEMIGEQPEMERILAESDGRCRNTKERRDSQHIEVIKAIFPSALYNASEERRIPDWDSVAKHVMGHTYYGKSSNRFILMCHGLFKRCFPPAPARSAPVAPPAQTTRETPCQVAPTSTMTAVATPTRQAAEPAMATPAALPSARSPTAACEEDRKRQRDDDTTEVSSDQELQPDGSSELDAGLARHAPRKEMPSTAPSPTPAPQNSILAQLQHSAARKGASQ